jgi:inner membrane transporter RhtA
VSIRVALNISHPTILTGFASYKQRLANRQEVADLLGLRPKAGGFRRFPTKICFMTQKPILTATIAIVLAMIAVQSGAALAKTLFSTVGPQGITALRTFFGAWMLVIVWRPWCGERLSLRQIATVAAYGASLGGMNLMFYFSLSRLPMGIAVAIEFVGPFTLALFSSRRPADLLWLLLAAVGLVALLPMGDQRAALDPIGVLYGLASGLFWALYILFGRRAAGLMPGSRAAALGMATAALVTMPAGVFHAGTDLLAISVLTPALGVALLSSAIPYSLEMVALKHLPVRSFGILTSLEPPVAAIVGCLFAGEFLTLRQVAAILCITVACAGTTAGARRE